MTSWWGTCLIVPTASSSILIFCGGTYFGLYVLSLLLVCSIVLSVSVYSCTFICEGSDARLDDDILMQLPELYRYGRENYWFGTKTFSIYMIDAVYQVCNTSFLNWRNLMCVTYSLLLSSSSSCIRTSCPQQDQMGTMLHSTSFLRYSSFFEGLCAPIADCLKDDGDRCCHDR